MATSKIYQDRFSKIFDVLLATTGAEGINSAIKEKPDLIILDLILPGIISGFDVLKDIKMNPESKNIPVIVLTNLESQEKIIKDSGAVECLVKANTPINTVEETIKKYLKKQ